MKPREPARPQASAMRRAIGGVALALAGSGVVSGLFVISHCGGAFCERMAFRLGLAPAVLISAFAQTAVLLGLWLLWTAARRRRG